ncbi:unnamed protein product, partial [Prorocentrum cordatum]
GGLGLLGPRRLVLRGRQQARELHANNRGADVGRGGGIGAAFASRRCLDALPLGRSPLERAVGSLLSSISPGSGERLQAAGSVPPVADCLDCTKEPLSSSFPLSGIAPNRLLGPISIVASRAHSPPFPV